METAKRINNSRKNKKAEAPRLKAAVYARHSSTKQNAKSCEEQVMHIKHLVGKGDICSRKYRDGEIEIDEKWIIKDEAMSGRSASREGYQLIFDAMSEVGKEKPFDILLLDDLSRATRDLGNMLDLYQLAKANSIEIISVSSNLSSEDGNARTFFTVHGMVNDLGNEMHSMRTIRGMEAKILKGLSCGDLAYGYKSIPTRFDMEGNREVARDFKVEINEEKAIVIKKIFRMFLAGYGRTTICKKLHEEKIPWPGYYKKIQKGRGWTSSTIYRILTNEKYIGVWTWKKTKYVYNPVTQKKVQQNRPEREWVSHHEGQDRKDDLRIISQTVWNRAQSMFKKIHDNSDHGPWGRFFPFVQKYMLSQILKCAVCGGTMVLITGRKGGYYGCLDANRKGTCVNKRLIRRAKLEKAVVNYILRMLKNDSIFKTAADKYNETMNAKLSNGEKNISEYEHELAVIKVELKNLADAIMKGSESKTLFDAIEGKEKRQRQLTYQMKQTKALQKEKIFVTPGAMKEKFKRLAGILRKRPNEACEALKKLFPEGLKMLWQGSLEKPGQKRETGEWRITGMINLSTKGGASEIELVVK